MATTVPVTGLSQLGNVLLQGSADYANQRLRREAEERQRAQQLADIQSQRAFQQGQFDRQRGLMLEDEQRRRAQAQQDATIEVLLKEGWLKPTDIGNPQAVQMAADARQTNINTIREREVGLPAKLQQEADYLGEQDVAIGQIEARLNSILAQPQPGAPTEAETRLKAIQLTGVPTPSEKEISENMLKAAQAIYDERMQKWFMATKAAEEQIPLVRNQRTVIQRSLGTLLQQGYVPQRTPPPTPSASLALPLAQPVADPMAEFKAEIERKRKEREALTPAPAATNYSYPAASVLGLAERSGLTADDFSAERFAQAPMNILAAPGRAIDAAGRYGGAGLQGILTGDYTVPQKGLVTRAGEAIGSFFSPTIQPGDYMSEARARLLNLPRTPDKLPSLPPMVSPAFQFSNSYAPGN